MRPSLNIDLPEPEWLQLVRSENEGGKSVSQIARETGVPRPSLSMLLNGTYPAKSLDLVGRKHGAKIVEVYRDQVLCPHLRRGISKEECHRHATALMSTSNPEKLKQWRACRHCPFNPTQPNGEKE